MEPLQSISKDSRPDAFGVYPASGLRTDVQLCYGTSLTAFNPPIYHDEMQDPGTCIAMDQELVSTQELWAGGDWFLVDGN